MKNAKFGGLECDLDGFLKIEVYLSYTTLGARNTSYRNILLGNNASNISGDTGITGSNPNDNLLVKKNV
jgi:hypothetical protein